MPTEGTWLECNGQSTAAYPVLAAIIGANVPDYRGIFLRGWGSQISNHYGTVTHSSAILGELQGDAIRNITGAFAPCSTNIGNSGIGALQNSGSTTAYRVGGDIKRDSGAANIVLDTSLVVPIADENRPINRAVIYLMKAG